MIEVVLGNEYKVTLHRGKTYTAVRPICEEGVIIGWWMRGGDDMKNHAFRLAKITEEVSSGALR